MDCNHTMYLTVNRPNSYMLHHYFDMFDNVRVCNSETKTSLFYIDFDFNIRTNPCNKILEKKKD